jgi:UDP-N-acetylmuramate: L-alanyl-gamma-D-glutamyl-meso-diaminopimelate ligase
MPKSYHFIASGDAAMQHLALSLQQQGHTVSGSTTQKPDPNALHAGLDAVVLGAHIPADHPELTRAQELSLPIVSVAQFIHEQSQQKQRIVVTGSHGKTVIAGLILHVLRYVGKSCDYVVGTSGGGAEPTVRLTGDADASGAPVILIEGDETPASALDPQPAFLHYKPHMLLISSIAWQHADTYPTYEQYVAQFELLADQMPKAGVLLFDETDNLLDVIGQKDRPDVQRVPYEAHPHTTREGRTYLTTPTGTELPVQADVPYDLKNIAGAMAVCDRLGITDEQFYEAIQTV